MTLSRTGSPRILLVTPEIAYLPDGIAAKARQIRIGSGPLAKTSAALVASLFQRGADIHVALPNFRRLFTTGCHGASSEDSYDRAAECGERVHLAQDRNFFYWDPQASEPMVNNLKIALAFQREVINHIVPIVQPELIHCMGWMTGLIPAMARERDIPCLFSIQNCHTGKACLDIIEDRGIDAAAFWHHLYYDACPSDYDAARETIPVDFLASGALASCCVSMDNPNLLGEMVNGQRIFSDEGLKLVLTNKWEAGCAVGIDNTQHLSFHPAHDHALFCNYTVKSQVFGKKTNKRFFQKELGLQAEPHTPLVIWPYPGDGRHETGRQPNPIIAQLINSISTARHQLVFCGDVTDKHELERMITCQTVADRVAWCDASERMLRQAYAAADFVLRPTGDEFDDLWRISGRLYGALPIAPLQDRPTSTLGQLDSDAHTGNGFLFKDGDQEGLFAAIHRAIAFYQLPAHVVNRQIQRIMTQSVLALQQRATTDQYMTLYEKMLHRPLRSVTQRICTKAASSVIPGRWPRFSLVDGHFAQELIKGPWPQDIPTQSASR